MSAMFTQQALERMRERDVAQHEMDSLLETVQRLAEDPSVLVRSGEVERVKQKQGDDAFIVRAGEMRALVTVDPAVPEQVIVMSVYRADPGPAGVDSARPSRRAEEALAHG